MPNPSDVTKKIDYLTEIAINDYGIDADWMCQEGERTKKINERADAAGFVSTDVFMGEDGVLALSAYLDNGSLGIAVINGGYDVYVEIDRKVIVFVTNQTIQQAFSYLDRWGRPWHLYEFSQGTPTIQTEKGEGSTQMPYGKLEQVEFRLLIPNALTQRALIYAGS